MNGVPGIRVERLVRRFGAKAAVDDISFDVPRGTVLGLLGFNGAGKSTTMDVLATLAEPSSGRAEVAGFDVVAHALDARRRLAVVFESAVAPRPAWTVDEYLRYFRMLRGRTGPADAEVLSLLGLEALRGQTTGTLSAGQRKRVEIARAMEARPEVLLLDEPTKEVDMRGKRDVWRAIRAQAAAGATVLISTHDVLEVREVCDRVLVLHEGKLTAALETRDIRGADPIELEETLVARMEGR